MKPVVWVGDTKRRLKGFPDDVQDEIGFALERAQWGRTHHNAKRVFEKAGHLTFLAIRNLSQTPNPQVYHRQIYHCFAGIG